MASGILISLVVLCGIAGFSALIVNRFRKKSACCLALIAGFSPCLFFMASKGIIDGEILGIYVGMYGAAPLFIIAFFVFGFGEITKLDKIAAAVSIIGSFLGGSYSLLLVALLAQAE